MAIDVSNLSSQQLKRAADIKDQIEKLESELSSLLGSPRAGQSASNGKPGPGRKSMSDAARKKIAAAMKARWAARKREAKPTAMIKKPAAAKKPAMSAAAKARLSALAKARWAKAKAAGKKNL